MEITPTRSVDPMLIARLSAGDAAAFRQVFDLYHQKLYAFSLKFTKSRVLSEEIVQEVFIKVWENRAGLNPELSLGAYLYKITQNKVFDFLKKAALDQSVKKGLIRHVERMCDPIEADIFLAEYETIIKAAISQLPPQRKLIFEMSRDQYLSHEEIARQLGIAKNTVKVQIVKASRFIREYLHRHADIPLALAAWLALA